MTSQVESRQGRLTDIGGGLSTKLTIKDYDRAFIGFCHNMDMDPGDFICHICGETPEYLIFDGKRLGPRPKEVDHLQEFDRHPDDSDSLEEGSKFKNRVFLHLKRERTLVGKLASGDIEIFEFLRENLSTDNGKLIQNLVRNIDERFHDEENSFPSCYQRLLSNLSKLTSVSGFLQATCPESLDILESFCNRQTDLRSVSQNENLKLIVSEFPALWPDLDEILDAVDADYLPVEVSDLIKRLIEMRRNIFLNSPDRFSTDYVEYDWEKDFEHPTQFWPNWEILCYPKKYNVRNVRDADLCNKNYRIDEKHPAGIFSGGCPHNITFGFELTLNQESPHNAFRLLQCRDLDTSKLKGLINHN